MARIKSRDDSKFFYVVLALVAIAGSYFSHKLIDGYFNEGSVTYCDFRQPKSHKLGEDAFTSNTVRNKFHQVSEGCLPCPKNGHCEGGKIVSCRIGYRFIDQTEGCVLDSERERRIAKISNSVKAVVEETQILNACSSKTLVTRLFSTEPVINRITMTQMRRKVLEANPILSYQDQEEFLDDFASFFLSLKNSKTEIKLTQEDNFLISSSFPSDVTKKHSFFSFPHKLCFLELVISKPHLNEGFISQIIDLFLFTLKYLIPVRLLYVVLKQIYLRIHARRLFHSIKIYLMSTGMDIPEEKIKHRFFPRNNVRLSTVLTTIAANNHKTILQFPASVVHSNRRKYEEDGVLWAYKKMKQ